MGPKALAVVLVPSVVHLQLPDDEALFKVALIITEGLINERLYQLKLEK